MTVLAGVRQEAERLEDWKGEPSGRNIPPPGMSLRPEYSSAFCAYTEKTKRQRAEGCAVWKYGIRPAAGPGLSAKLGRLASGFFLAGFLAGLILIFAGQESLVQGSSFLDSVSLEGLAALQIDRRGLLLYSMRQRLLPAGILVLASAAGIGGAAAAFFLLWSGFCAGVLLSVLSLRYGIRGILLFAGGIFPQAAALVPAFWMLCVWCMLNGRGAGKPFLAQKAPGLSSGRGILLLILCILLGGCVLEAYVNPPVLGRMLRFL